MIKQCLLIFTLAIPLFCSAQSDKIDEATVQIHGDSDGHFSNLETLNKNFEGVRVVTLGEQTHFDGATFDAKIQLVKYLHENLTLIFLLLKVVIMIVARRLNYWQEVILKAY